MNKGTMTEDTVAGAIAGSKEEGKEATADKGVSQAATDEEVENDGAELGGVVATTTAGSCLARGVGSVGEGDERRRM